MVNVSDSKNYKVIGTNPIRHDGYDKVTGRAVYGADIKLPGLIWASIVRSPHAHAVIKNIDTSAAEKVDGVFAVMTGKDLPHLADSWIDHGEGTENIAWSSENILATKKTLYKGHAVAAVAARDRYVADYAASKIKVEYDVLDSVTNVEDATKDGAPILLEDLVGDHIGKKVKNTNIASITRHEFGDPDKAFNDAEHVVERTFTLQMVHQGYIEPHNATAVWDEEDRIKIWTSTQGAFPVRTSTAAILDMDVSRVKVTPLEIGGGFGGKIPIYLEPIVATLSKKTGRPVKAIMERSNVFQASGPAPGGTITVKMGTDKNGKLIAADTSIKLEAGGFPGAAVGAAVQCIFAPYDIPNTRIDGYDIVVNKPKSAAYRAPGSPQAAFATETVVNELAELHGMDRVEFRQINASKEGTRRADGVVFPVIGNEEVLDAAKASDHWNSELGEPMKGRIRGRGIASGYWFNVGLKSTVSLTVNTDGTVALVEGSTDIGGTRTSISMQAAEILGIPVTEVRPTVGDTETAGYADVTGGSRTTYATGFAAVKAAENLIEVLKDRCSVIWSIDKNDIDFDNGSFFATKDPELKFTFKELAANLDSTGGPAAASGSVDLESAGGAFGTHIVDLDVDPDTGKTDVVRYTAVQDVGTTIYPAYCIGNIQGGVVQGIGWGLNEEYFMTKDGAQANTSYLDYRMPTALDLPNIDVVLVEKPNPGHPFGVRGVGEVPICPPIAAIGDALHNALGKRFYDAPMKPGRILNVLGKITD